MRLNQVSLGVYPFALSFVSEIGSPALIFFYSIVVLLFPFSVMVTGLQVQYSNHL